MKRRLAWALPLDQHPDPFAPEKAEHRRRDENARRRARTLRDLTESESDCNSTGWTGFDCPSDVRRTKSGATTFSMGGKKYMLEAGRRGEILLIDPNEPSGPVPVDPELEERLRRSLTLAGDFFAMGPDGSFDGWGW